MNNTADYRGGARHHRVDQDGLYIDHSTKATPKGRWRQLFMESTQPIVARFNATFKKRLRISSHSLRVRNELQRAGLSRLDLLKPETFYIAHLIHKGETILGAMVGKLDDGGSALIVVTELRIIYLDQIPLFTKMDEVGYGIVTGISSSDNQWGAAVTLHTAIGDFTLHSVTPAAARHFITAIERVAIDLSTDQPSADKQDIHRHVTQRTLQQ